MQPASKVSPSGFAIEESFFRSAVAAKPMGNTRGGWGGSISWPVSDPRIFSDFFELTQLGFSL